MSNYKNACEFIIPIVLKVPIYLEPEVIVKPTEVATQKMPVYLQPDIYLNPEVSSRPPVCITHQNGNGYTPEPEHAKQIMPQT